MRTFHIMDKKAIYSLVQGEPGIHYIDLDETYVLASLPHGLQHPKSTPISSTVGRHPQFSLLATKLGAVADDTVFDLAEKARAVHPLMGL
jgi:hypothetical protein